MKEEAFQLIIAHVTLYIPHGSDERVKDGDVWQLGEHLYIPHGSDESLITLIKMICLKNFISHMVQMKEINNNN